MLEYFIYLFQYSAYCFCGNTLDPINYPKRPEKDCKMPCKGNTQQMCGGAWRNSIYYQNGNSNKYIYIIHHLQTHTKNTVHSKYYTSVFQVMTYWLLANYLQSLHRRILIVCFLVFKATFNNISVISWGSALLVEKAGGLGEKHR
jgi:hypothetical protein